MYKKLLTVIKERETKEYNKIFPFFTSTVLFLVQLQVFSIFRRRLKKPTTKMSNEKNNSCYDEEMFDDYLMSSKNKNQIEKSKRKRGEENEDGGDSNQSFINQILNHQDKTSKREENKIYSNSIGNTTMLSQQKKTLKQMQKNHSSNNFQFSKGNHIDRKKEGTLIKER
jgi:hypothetical protein